LNYRKKFCSNEYNIITKIILVAVDSLLDTLYDNYDKVKNIVDKLSDRDKRKLIRLLEDLKYEIDKWINLLNSK